MENKYSLVLDTLPMSFSLDQGSREAMIKAHKKWSIKIKRSLWIDIPAKTPVTMNTKVFIALRVVEITPEQEKASQVEQDPRYKTFFQNAKNIGPDITDQGYK